MEYKIGEVSKITNISKEMIRYYEKQGALTPTREEDNNYRSYSTMDIFLLMEIVRYQGLQFTVKDITELLKDNYYKKYSEHLYHYSQEIEKEISYKMLLKERVKLLAVRSNRIQLNLGNYWVKKIPELNLVHLLKSHGDDYERFNINPVNQKMLFHDDHMIFFESFVLFEENEDSWWYSIRKHHAEQLHLDMVVEKSLPAQFCLCTIVDMGEIGDFSRDCLKDIYQHLEEKQYKVIGDPRGIIIGRGYDGDKFTRMMEIQIPIEV